MYAFLGHLVAATIGTAAPAPAAPRGRAGSSSSVADAAAAAAPAPPSVAAPTVDGWAAGALFDAVARASRSADGKLRADELLGALAPARRLECRGAREVLCGGAGVEWRPRRHVRTRHA